uniref:Uncharacterized protein n=1 Tax=Lotharella globosa TaxID=91324 RepID=A0A7S3ZD78_9EUKA|mmetsp:Transcript_19434/g.39309  ORF Transcript_19434/g.39309 Transcript_19434/m.39309 type:complete len:443 (+) Transcript_19434:54-1382(+)
MRFHGEAPASAAPRYLHAGSTAAVSPTSSTKYRARNLGKINLKRVERFRTRDLFQSHAERMGLTRTEVEREVRQNPYRPRTTPVMKHMDYPSTLVKRTGPADPFAFSKQLRAASTHSAKERVDETWLQNRRREASQRRLKHHTQRLLGQWARQLARFEEEAAYREEASMALRAQMRKSRGGSAGPARKQFWIQDAWTEEVAQGEEEDDEDEEEASPTRSAKHQIPRISAKERNAGRSQRPEAKLPKNQHYAERQWKLPNGLRPGTAGIAPGMKPFESNSAPNAVDPIAAAANEPVVRPNSSNLRSALNVGVNPRGAARDALSFSPFQPFSMYQRGTRASSPSLAEEEAEAEIAEGRIQCDRIKLKMARYGIHIKRGHLERALIAPQFEPAAPAQLELTDQQKQNLADELTQLQYFAFPKAPPGSKPESKKSKKSKKSKRRKK